MSVRLYDFVTLCIKGFKRYYEYVRVAWVIYKMVVNTDYDTLLYPLLNKLDRLRKKWSFALRVSLVNVTKSAVFCGFGHIYWRNR